MNKASGMTIIFYSLPSAIPMFGLNLGLGISLSIMSGEGPLKKKHVNELQMSRTMPGAALKKINQLIFSYMVAKMKSSDSSYWLPITLWLHGLLSGEDPPIKEVLESGLVPALLLFLTVENFPELQVEAAKALKYLASGTSEVAKLTIDQAVVAKALETSDVTKVAIVQAVHSTHDALRHLLYSEDDTVLSHACCSLAVLSGCKDVKIRELIRESGLYHRLMELISQPTLVVPALRTLGNIVLGDDFLIECIIKDDVLAHLRKFLGHNNVDVRKETCWIITYIAAGNGRWIQPVIDAGLIAPLVHAVRNDEFVVMEAAVWAISNATSGATSEQIKFMVSENCIEVLCHLFCCRDSEMFKVCLEGLENILKAGEVEKSKDETGVNPYVEHIKRIQGWTVLEVASYRYERKLYKKGLKLIVKYGSMPQSAYIKHVTSNQQYGNADYDNYVSSDEEAKQERRMRNCKSLLKRLSKSS